ncbi:MAG: hypothetical protein ACXAC2_00835 [Candidatus Kariarchaeaceae archaeon]|jgi:hypothetical protein
MDQIDILNVQNQFTDLLKDDIVKTLLKESHITKIQLETIYIDLLSPNILQKQIKFTDKVNLRIKDVKISRGAFIRTLRQSKRNIIKSINTILLLGYIGIFDTPRLQSYIEISNRLHSLLESYKEINEYSNEDVLSLLKQELIQDIQKGI